MATHFTLSERQERELKEWQEKIKELFGKYGHYDYIFTPYGMGTGLKVKSHLTGIENEFNEEYEGLNGCNIDYFNPWINK